MKAFTLGSFDTAPAFRDDLPEPGLADDQLLVRVQASSVNPVDAMVAAGFLKAMAEYEFPVVLGRDFAGVVERTGPAVTGYAAGDDVFGFVSPLNPTVRDGSWAELIAVGQDVGVARRPAGVSPQDAGALGVAALNALAAYDAISPTMGTTVLVIGATGGVGSFFVQLAAYAGARVVAPALAEDTDYLRGLGAAEVIERKGDVAGTVRASYPDGVDALVDLVSTTPDEFEANAAVLADGASAVSSVGVAGDGPGRVNTGSIPTPENLGRLATLVAAGTLVVPVQASYTLQQAGEALGALGSQHTQGKRVITVP